MIKNQHTIYGINGSGAVLASRKYKVIDIFIQSGSQAERDSTITQTLNYHGGRVNIIKAEHFKAKFGRLRTQGIVVIFNGPVEEQLPSFKSKSGNIGLLVLDRIEDPQNLGQIIRTAECAGIGGIIIPKHDSCGITDTVIQVSQGAFTQIPIYQVSNLHQTITNLKDEDFWVIAMENSLKAKEWYKIDYSGKILIIIGSEGRGIKKLLLEKSDFKATIPMEGKTNSLNVSAAVSAVIFERLRQIST
ncbi:23S rRNA (guanosine(2251)-2'-O)-methyltransferase RlmB [Candidatus Marinimicrobia bacterium]|jgi:23S rRNA (guanosine2251-2'-O)-methyltransferase|nr:23S rRNA (guanosine(2251)-2'-O)-methyltransferase RlmB [Candidatus Neomarinimicrobiota bacterium]|tara:strand:- start:2519 stop:3256 length:738 start_codon:yes stop_codon:yes gene_type:complete